MPKKIRQTITHFLVWIALLGMRRAIVFVPHRIRAKIGSGLGASAFLLLRKEREKTLEHLRLALGHEKSTAELVRIGRDCFRNLGRNALDVMRLDRISGEELEKTVTIDGEDRLEKASAPGRGVIFITGHIGNWELMAAFFARKYNVAVIAAPIYDTRIETLMVQIRRSRGIDTFIRDSPGVNRKIMRFLRGGGVLGILIDQAVRTAGIPVPFFNKMAYTTQGAANLALRTGAEVVAGFISRVDGNRHRIVLEGPLSIQRTRDMERDLKENTAFFTRIIEEQVRKVPEQWVWMHRRWRTVIPEDTTT